MSGHDGAVRVGYQTALQLGDWSLTLLPEVPRRYQFSAAVVAMSAYWLAQTPLVLRVEVGGRRWSWALREPPAVQDGRIALTLEGAPDVLQDTLTQEQSA